MNAVWGRLKLLGDILWTFGKISPMTFGGGYAMLPTMERVVVEQRGWVSDQEMAEIISVSGSAPGGVGVNAAAYIGYRIAGVAGALSAVLGITIPTFLIIIIASLTLLHFQYHPKVEAALKGIHAAIIALIAYAAFKMIKRVVFDVATSALLVITVGILLMTPIHPIYIITGSMVAGISIIFVKRLTGAPIRLEKTRPEFEKESDTGAEKIANADFDLQTGLDAGSLSIKKPNYKYQDYYIAEGI